MTVDIICADVRDALARFPNGHFHCCVSSPPFWGLRDYGLEPTVWGGDGCEHEWGEEKRIKSSAQQDNGPGGGVWNAESRGTEPSSRRTEFETTQGAFCRRCNAWRGTLGLEPTPELYVEHLVGVMREVRRVLRDDGTLWLNLGDSYTAGSNGARDPERWPKQSRNADGFRSTHSKKRAGLKPKDLVGVPWRVAFALQADGWWLRSDIVWSKPNPMPESVTDRPTRSHEYLFLLTKSARYYYDQDAIREHTGTEATWEQWEKSDGRHAPHGTLEEGVNAGFGSKQESFTHPAGRNKRSVWEIATQPFGLEMCAVCRTIYTPAQYRRQRGGSAPRCTYEIGEDDQCCGTKWLAQDGGAVCVACETFYSAKELEHLPRAAKCRKCGSEEWLSHFAVFPEKLVEPCILAGTSEWGCCPECGAPWERVVEKEYRSQLQRGEHIAEPDTWKGTKARPRRRSDDGRFLPRTDDAKPSTTAIWGAGGTVKRFGDGVDVTTTGWRPTCKHGAEPVPCRVLDPFAGSGTVGVVAERLGRHSVLIDAKEEYCEMARHRTAQRGLMVEAAS